MISNPGAPFKEVCMDMEKQIQDVGTDDFIFVIAVNNERLYSDTFKNNNNYLFSY